MPNPIKSVKGLTELAGVGVESGRAAIRELLNIIKEGAAKDPAKIFMAERMTGPRIGPTPEIVPPKGFNFGGMDPRITRAPALVEKRKVQEQVYSQFQPVGGSMRGNWVKSPKAESIRSLEELGAQTSAAQGSRVMPKLSGRWTKPTKGAGKLTDEQVRTIRQASGSHSDLAKQHGVSEATIAAVRRRESYQWVK